MRKNIVIVVVVVLGVILSLFLGCQDDLIETLEKVQAHVEISVKLPEELKTPDFKPDDFVFSLNWFPVDDESDVTKEEFDYEENIGIVFQFAPGEYTFEIIAKDKNTGDLKASGRATTSILPGQRDQLEIPLTYYVFGGDSGFTVEDGVITLSGKLTFTSDQTITVPSDMKLVIEDGCIIDVGDGNTLTIDGPVEGLGNLTIKGNLDITDEFTVAGDLTLTGDTTLTISAGKELSVGGAIEVEGDLVVSGEGKLHTKEDLTVGGDFKADSGVTVVVDATLDVENTTDIEGKVSIGSLPTEEGITEFTVTVAPGGSLEVFAIDPMYEKLIVEGGGALTITGDTTLKEVVLDDASTLNIDGTLKSDNGLTLSGDGSLTAGNILADKLTNSGDLAVTADSIVVDEIALGANSTLNLTGDVTTGLFSGDGIVAVDGVLGGVDGNLAITGSPTVEGDLSLESGIIISFDDNSILEVTGSVEAEGDLILAGNGELKVTEDLRVAGSLTATDNQLDVDGDISENTLLYGVKPDLIVNIEAGVTLKLEEIGDGWKTVTVTGGGTLKVETVTVELDEITLEDGSKLEVKGALESTGELKVSGTGALTAGSIEVDKLTSEGNQTITAGNFDVREIAPEANKTLTLKGDVKTEVVSGMGDLIVVGEVTLKELAIEDGANLEASSLVVVGDTLTITGGGTLKIDDDISSDKIVLEDSSKLKVVGEVESEIISGEGTIFADSVSTEKINSTGDLTISADPITANEIVLKDGKVLTLTGDVTAELISGDGTLVANGAVEGAGGNLTITGTPVVDGDLYLEAGTTISFTAGSSLEVSGSVEAEGDLVLSGNGSLEVTGNLTVEDNFTTDVDANVGDTLAAGNNIAIDGDVSVGSLTMEGTSTLTIKKDSSLEIEEDGTTTLGEIVLEGSSSKLEVKGDLESNEISGKGTLEANSVTTNALSNTDDLTITAETISAGVIELEDNKTLTLEGDVTTGLISGDGKLAVDGVVGGVDGNLAITGSPTVEGDLSLESGITISFDDNSTLKVTGNVEAEGNLTISGNGTLDVDGYLNVAGNLTAADDQLDVDGDISENTLLYGVKPDLVVHIEAGVTLELEEIGDGWKTVAVTGGGTFKVETVTVELDKITLEDGSALEIEGALTLSDGASLSLGDDATLTVAENMEAKGALILTGEGALDAKEKLTVTGNFTTEANVNVVNTLTVNGDAEIESRVTVGSVTMGVASTLTIKEDGSLEIKDDGTTDLNEIVLEDGSMLEIDGALQSTTISGEGTLLADSVTVDNISNTGDLAITADSITVEEIELEANSTLTFTGDVTTEIISGDGTLSVEGVVGGVGKDLTIKGSPTIDGDLYLEGGIKISFDNNPTLKVTGDVEALGDLTLLEEGTLDVEKGLKVVGAFYTETNITIENLLDVGEDVEIDSVVTVGSIAMGDLSTLTIKEDGSLDIKDDGTTNLNEIVLEDKSELEVAGKLESETISGKGSLKADSIGVTEIALEDGDTLELKGAVIVEEVSGEGIAEVEGTVTVENITIADTATLEATSLIVEDGALTVSGGGTLKVIEDTSLDAITLENGSTLEIEGELTLSASASLTFSDNATLEVGENVEALGDLTLSGKGTLSVTGDLAVTGKLTVGDDVVVDVKGDTAVGFLASIDGKGIVINIETGTTLEVTSLDEGDDTVTVSGGGTLKVNDDTTLKEIALDDNSMLEIIGYLKSKDAEEIEITGSGSVKVIGEVEVTDLSIGSGTVFDISEGTLGATGDVTLEGTLELGATEWDSVTFGAQGNIILADDTADLTLNGNSIKWYTLNGAKAKYSKVDGDVLLTFVEGSGAQKVTPAGTDKTPTEIITRVASGVTFEIPDNRNNFYLEADDKFIVEDGGTFDAGAWWFGNFNSNLFKGSIIIKGDGNFLMSGGGTGRLAVGRNEGEKSWHSWAWKQDGTITEINRPATQWKFTAIPGEGTANNKIDISYTGDVNTPIEIGEGVTATISKKLVQKSSVFTIKGTVIVANDGEFIVEEEIDEALVLGAIDAGLIVKPGGTLKYSSDKWLSSAGVGNNGFVQIEGGSFVSLGGPFWFGPTPSNPDSRINLGSNIIVEIRGSLLTAYRKSELSDDGNILSSKIVDGVFATPGLDILVKKGVEFNVKDYFGGRGHFEVEEGAFFTVEGSFAIGVRTYEKKVGATSWTPITPAPQTDKTLTINSGATFEIKSGGKILTIGNGKINGGIIDINPGATVKLGGNVVESPVKASFTNYVSAHTVKYGENVWEY